MKRFTETLKWDDPWFRQLPGVQKLLFLYIIDRCNNAGFWEVDEEAMAFHTKLDRKYFEGAWKGLQRGIIGASGWVWVRNFLRHQKNEVLNADNPAHKQIIALLREQTERFDGVPEFSTFLAPYKGLLSPIGIGNGTGQGKRESAEREVFRQPTREEAVNYGREIGMVQADVLSWYDHFDSNGWKVGGKAKMKDWQAALRNGQRNASKNGNGKTETAEPVEPAGWAEFAKTAGYSGQFKHAPEYLKLDFAKARNQ